MPKKPIDPNYDAASKSKIKIDKNVPMPSKHKIPPFPFADMEVGDSFAVPKANLPQTVGYRAAVFAREQTPTWKFKIRKTPSGHRCWRVI